MFDSMLSALVVISLTGVSAWIWSMLVNARPRDPLYLRPHSIRRGVLFLRRKRKDSSQPGLAVQRRQPDLTHERAQDVGRDSGS
ncbi:hypothetical protein [Halotalea alkalilenta]|uniref:Uncharacterized protein n=1 Tax=Halotalea alkalilenta TaxID=376489 RepID=A0A172YJC0_9GAMM|nr:hypothetical protein [Halotalea alkalilenta]ANF59331.1 hypothetical protein A5892_19260 [Halotalea alkalilenta]